MSDLKKTRWHLLKNLNGCAKHIREKMIVMVVRFTIMGTVMTLQK